jgi:glutathione S-transferase
MKLYYTPAVCSLASHIVLEEAGLDYTAEKVDLKTKKTETGQDFNAISAKSLVPLLVLNDGRTLSEGAAILQYLTDLKPEANLAPKNGTFERYQLQEWLNYIATEVHKTHFPLFNAEPGKQAAEVYTAKLKKAYDYLSAELSGKSYLMGEQFTVADAYLFTVVNWHNFIKLDLSPWPVLVAYQQRISSRPAVQRTLAAEGLVQKQAA